MIGEGGYGEDFVLTYSGFKQKQKRWLVRVISVRICMPLFVLRGKVGGIEVMLELLLQL